MLTVTKKALDRLSRRLAQTEAAEDKAMRFTRRPGGWKLSFDDESDGDTIITHDGRKVLLLDETVAEAMANMTLDVRASSRGKGLKLSGDKRRRD